MCVCPTGTRELLHERWREEGRKQGRREIQRQGGVGWKRRRRRRRRPHRGLAGQLLPQGPDMRDTFILTGRVTPESSEEETGSITEEGQTFKEQRKNNRRINATKKEERAEEETNYSKTRKVSILLTGTCTIINRA